ncbi:hypothetical protein A9Q84_02725 [Halobacteriovorax marinus]|uniref:Lipoprotein n=1 Tax=Halobacteriovorax marinus TaxID=97084 RepID=A0A1Y5FCV3_9BACT|nr:hypothetical protein A9Q84_02725 [Halobacteriovorax marinus]
MSMTKKFTFLVGLSTSAVFLTACSSGYSYRRPESINDKISRYQSRSINSNVVPEMALRDFSYKRKTRGPASVSSSEKDEGLNQYNNKRLYFLTLFSQYQTMSKYSDNSSSPKLNHCPSFHTSFLNYKEMNQAKVSKVQYKVPYSSSEKLNDQKFLSNYPEFLLPVTKDNLRPRVIDYVAKKNYSKSEVAGIVKNAISVHLSKTYSELSELCDTGSSSNYYVYENLITHIKTKKKISPNSIGLKTLFKTTLFSNMALTNSLKKSQKVKSRSIASFAKKQSYDKEVMKRLEVPWVESYFHSK